MSIREFYEIVGGNFDEALSRLMNEQFIKKFLKKFPADDSYFSLKSAIEQDKLEDAFRAAHTLKGVAYNLELKSLGDSASSLTEALRPGNEERRIPEDLKQMMKIIDTEYSKAVDAINNLD